MSDAPLPVVAAIGAPVVATLTLPVILPKEHSEAIIKLETRIGRIDDVIASLASVFNLYLEQERRLRTNPIWIVQQANHLLADGDMTFDPLVLQRLRNVVDELRERVKLLLDRKEGPHG